MLIIGSIAAINQGLVLANRTNIKDIDYVGTQEELESFGVEWQELRPNHWYYNIADDNSDKEGVIEFEVAIPGSSTELLLKLYPDEKFAPPEALYALKMSHRYRKNSPHFYKTMFDIYAMREQWFCNRTEIVDIAPELVEFYELRQQETYGAPPPKKTSGRTKKEFFTTEGVDYIYDHDSIHEAVALGERPIYISYLGSDEQVNWDPAKFFALPYETQLAAIYEEAAVLALERSVIPLDVDPRIAFDISMQKFVANISHGQFRDFAYDHFFEVYRVVAENKWDYHSDFLKGLENGVVKPHAHNDK